MAAVLRRYLDAVEDQKIAYERFEGGFHPVAIAGAFRIEEIYVHRGIRTACIQNIKPGHPILRGFAKMYRMRRDRSHSYFVICVASRKQDVAFKIRYVAVRFDAPAPSRNNPALQFQVYSRELDFFRLDPAMISLGAAGGLLYALLKASCSSRKIGL